MMKKRLTALCAAVLLYPLGAAAQLEEFVIDFEGLAPLLTGKDSIAMPGYVEDGFGFASTVDPLLADDAFSAWGPANQNFNGSTALFNTYDTTFTLLTRQDSTPFSLLSIDLSPAFDDPGSPGTILFRGLRTDNSVVTQEFVFGPQLQPVTRSFGAGFSNLVEVRWEQEAPSHQFDNIRVAAIPEPRSVAMLVAGLILMTLTLPSLRGRGAT